MTRYCVSGSCSNKKNNTDVGTRTPPRHHNYVAVMAFARAVATLIALAAVCFVSPASAFVVGGPLRVGSSTTLATHASSKITHVSPRRSQQQGLQQGVRGLRAAASNEEAEGDGGFVNPYTAFRKWQLDLVSWFERGPSAANLQVRSNLQLEIYFTTVPLN